jgi:hypothetical protein
MDKGRRTGFCYCKFDESGMQSIFFGRLKIENDQITELELNIIRSRKDSGFCVSSRGNGQTACWMDFANS